MEDTLMLLCDVGNTSYHFYDDGVDYKEQTKSFLPQTIKETVYYICVNPRVKKVLILLQNWVDLSSYISMDKYYSTMGIDRIFACEAIANGVIVDAGSAITVDVVEDGAFVGGFIYPGIRAMQSTYENISSALEYPFNYDLDLSKLPQNSRDAISYGYLKLLHSEVISKEKKIYLTGGDAHMLLPLFSTATVHEHLLFDGMKKILQESK